MAEQNNADNSSSEKVVILPEVQNELSKVATSPKKSFLILLIAGGALGYFAFTLFINNKSSTSVPEVVVPTQVTAPPQAVENEVPEIPKLPEPPKLQDPVEEEKPAPTIPVMPSNPAGAPPVPAMPVMPNSPLLQDEAFNQGESADLPSKLSDSDEATKRKIAKRKASMILIAGKEQTKSPEQIEQESNFKYRGDANLLLGQGKIIDAILESAINSDFIGEIRAIVSRDVYAEDGKLILIPKGSRVYGTFNIANQDSGRVGVIWEKVNLANGYSVQIKSDAVDHLGRKGAQGRVDNKFKERMTNSILLSAFNIGVAKGLDMLVTPPPTSQAAASQTQAATSIQNVITATNSNANLLPAQKITAICTQVLALITDTSSTAYTTIQNACAAAPNNANPDQALLGLQTAINGAVTSLVTTAATATSPTQAQGASKTAFTDITNTAKEMITAQKFTPTITINQGTPIKIYVNKDYRFPKAAVSKSRLMQ